MPTRIGYVGQGTTVQEMRGGSERCRFPIVKADANGNYIYADLQDHWLQDVAYFHYYTANKDTIVLAPYEYPYRVTFSDYSPADGGWGLPYHHEYGDAAIKISLSDGEGWPQGNLATLVAKEANRSRITGTFDIDPSVGKLMAGKPMSIWWQSVQNASGLKLKGHFKVTIETTYIFTKCGAPTNFTGTLPTNGWITLTWGAGAAGIENPVSGYQIQYSDSNDGVNWGTWIDMERTAAGTLTTRAWNNPESGKFRRFRIRALATAGDSWASDWAVSNSIPSDTTPPTFDTSVTSLTATGVLNPVTAGVHIKGLTKIKADITNASGHAPKTVASQSIDMQQYGRADAATMTSGVVNAAGDVTITYRVTDSHGYFADASTTITVLDYYKPGVQVQMARCADASMRPDALGEYIMYKVITNFTNVDGNAIASVIAKINNISYPLVADEQWHVIDGYTQSPTVRREVTVTVTDKFTSASVQMVILTANYAIYLNETGDAIGFGKATEHQNSVEISEGRTLYLGLLTLKEYIQGVIDGTI